MGVIQNGVNAVKNAYNKAKDFLKKIVKGIRFFVINPIGHILGWIFLIVFIIILLSFIGRVIAHAIGRANGVSWQYSTFQEDLAVIEQLKTSGYESLVNAENFQDFKAYEYGVLIDVADYLRGHLQDYRFDIGFREGEYEFERDLIRKHLTAEKREQLEESGKLDLLEEKEPEADTPLIELVKVDNMYDQGDANFDLKAKMEQAMHPAVRTIDFQSELQELTGDKTVLGGTNRVKEPYLVYEFKKTALTATEDSQSSDTTKRTVTYGRYDLSHNKIADSYLDSLGKTTNTTQKETGNIEPFLYIVKDNIEFNYFFNENDEVIEYPLLLNAYNATLNLGSENGEEVNRVTLGLPVRVWPDTDPKEYTQVPYYTGKNEPTIYKIPLRTIVGRYMPRAELMMAWSYLKQDIEQETTETNATSTPVDTSDLITYTLQAIKGVYNQKNDAEEEREIVEAEVKTTDAKNKTTTKEYQYTDLLKTDYTFLGFQKAGIETTMYSFSQPSGVSATEKDIKIVTDLKNAIIAEEKVKVSYRVNNIANEKEVDLTTLGVGLKKGKVVLAMGDDEEGYVPPSSLEPAEVVISTRNQTVESLKSSIRSMILSQLVADVVGEERNGEFSYGNSDVIITIRTPLPAQPKESNIPRQAVQDPSVTGEIEEVQQQVTTIYIVIDKIEGLSGNDDYVRKNPIFIINDGQEETPKEMLPASKMTIWHMRMPIVLVNSASTWCREVTYEHFITQNQFKQNNKNYIIPKSVNSVGITMFTSQKTTDAYRGKAYAEVFSKLQEKDIVNMLLTLETSATTGSSDSYEYMRDLYRLVNASQEYAKNQGLKEGENGYIHPDTYKYVYLQDSIRNFDDAQTQKIYWLDLLAAKDQDVITKDELENMRTKDKEISWQVVEYEKYDECKDENGNVGVYALSPFGSEYVRAYYERRYQNHLYVGGDFNLDNGHIGADWMGRANLDKIKSKGNNANDVDDVASSIYHYELDRLKRTYLNNEAQAISTLNQKLSEQVLNSPIVAVAPGRVQSAGYSGRSGFYVVIQHADKDSNGYENVTTLYPHLKRFPLVSENDYVGAGTILGYEGSTGRSSGNHLHFEVHKAKDDTKLDVQVPEMVIFPTFNPFYNEEKALESTSIASGYLSLERTVREVEYNEEDGTPNLNNYVGNQHPREKLVDRYEDLIQKQGTLSNKKIRETKREDVLDWNTNYGNRSVVGDAKKFVEYLASQQKFDAYLKPEYFDEDLALEKGYLDVPAELLGYLYGDLTVKTDLPNALPALTEAELRTILEHWLAYRYRNNETKIDWLMSNVFTDANISTIIEEQNKTQVSAVFAIAVSTLEQNMGLPDENGNMNALKRNYNIFSIKGTLHGGVEYQSEGLMWNKYESYGEAFANFYDLIANRGPYFTSGRYTIGSIGAAYCPPGDHWSKTVGQLCYQMMQYYTGTGWSMPHGLDIWTGDNTAIVDNAKKIFSYMSYYNFSYATAGRKKPYYLNSWKEWDTYEGDWGDTIVVTETAASYADDYGDGANVKTIRKTNYRSDCTSYVTWVLFETAMGNGDRTFAASLFDSDGSYVTGEFRGSDFYRKLANALNAHVSFKGKNGVDYTKYFSLEYYEPTDGKFNSSVCQPGDILFYINKTRSSYW